MTDGIINVYKEQGYTSHDVVARLRGILKMKKIGHTGTLDPAAEGVLPVCLGGATKLCEFLTEKEKAYEAVLVLGKVTDTQDTTGQVLSEVSSEALEALTEEGVREAVLSFIGDYAQIPPMYSALKVDGKKLYELARQGKEVARQARPVVIHGIDILEMNLPTVRLRVCCSKGTYIRTLCHDIGEKLGVGGCMDSLLRIQSGSFLLADSLTLAQIEAKRDDGSLEAWILPVDSVFAERKALTVTEEGERLLYNGNPLTPSQVEGPDGQDFKNPVRIYDRSGQFKGLYQFEKQKGRYWPVKLFL